MTEGLITDGLSAKQIIVPDEKIKVVIVGGTTGNRGIGRIIYQTILEKYPELNVLYFLSREDGIFYSLKNKISKEVVIPNRDKTFNLTINGKIVPVKIRGNSLNKIEIVGATSEEKLELIKDLQNQFDVVLVEKHSNIETNLRLALREANIIIDASQPEITQFNLSQIVKTSPEEISVRLYFAITPNRSKSGKEISKIKQEHNMVLSELKKRRDGFTFERVDDFVGLNDFFNKNFEIIKRHLSEGRDILIEDFHQNGKGFSTQSVRNFFSRYSDFFRISGFDVLDIDKLPRTEKDGISEAEFQPSNCMGKIIIRSIRTHTAEEMKKQRITPVQYSIKVKGKAHAKETELVDSFHATDQFFAEQAVKESLKLYRKRNAVKTLDSQVGVCRENK